MCLICLTGCSGCSKSGRKNQMQSSRVSERKASPINKQKMNIERSPVSSNPTQLNTQESSLSAMYNKLKPAVFLIAVSYSEGGGAQGSGFFISSRGIGVSNYHVFKGGTRGKAYIKTADENIYQVGDVLDYNEDMDYIVFQVISNNLNFPAIQIAYSQPSIGEDVFAIGNPKGLEHTLSKGIVSSYRENDLYIQTTAEITHGSSGGALFNMRGEVVGITTAGYAEANLNFAINLQKLGIQKFVNR